VSGHPLAAGRAQDRESTPAKDRRSTTEPTPLWIHKKSFVPRFRFKYMWSVFFLFWCWLLSWYFIPRILCIVCFHSTFVTCYIKYLWSNHIFTVWAQATGLHQCLQLSSALWHRCWVTGRTSGQKTSFLVQHATSMTYICLFATYSGLLSHSTTKSGNRQMMGQVGDLAACMPKPASITAFSDPKFYWGRPVWYGKMWSFALW